MMTTSHAATADSDKRRSRARVAQRVWSGLWTGFSAKTCTRRAAEPSKRKPYGDEQMISLILRAGSRLFPSHGRKPGGVFGQRRTGRKGTKEPSAPARPRGLDARP